MSASLSTYYIWGDALPPAADPFVRCILNVLTKGDDDLVVAMTNHRTDVTIADAAKSLGYHGPQLIEVASHTDAIETLECGTRCICIAAQPLPSKSDRQMAGGIRTFLSQHARDTAALVLAAGFTVHVVWLDGQTTMCHPTCHGKPSPTDVKLPSLTDIAPWRATPYAMPLHGSTDGRSFTIDPKEVKLAFGVHQGKAIPEIPVQYLDWIIGQTWFVENKRNTFLVDVIKRYLDGCTAELDELGRDHR